MKIGLYKCHRFPTKIISHCVWLYHRFGLSLRAVEELLFEWGVVLGYESEALVLKFRSEYARRLKRRSAQPVDQAGNTLDILVSKRRDKRAAKHFLRKLLRDDSKPRVVVTNKRRSYGAALKELLPHTEHCQSRYLNSRVENSHRRTRRREWASQCFKSSGHAQRFLSIFEPLNNNFRPPATSSKHSTTVTPCPRDSQCGVK